DNNCLKKSLVNEFDAVVHMAAFKAAGESMTNPGKYSQNNLNGTINLLNAMTELGVKDLIFSSTAAVYGYPNYLPVDEAHDLKPINFYGYTKLVIEQIMQWYADLTGLRYVALRYFNAAGYDITGRIRCIERNPANLLPIVMELASGRKESMEVFGNDYNTVDGTGVRDYIHVSDLATAHVKALDYLSKNKKCVTLNLATGTGYSVLEVIKKAEEISGKNITYDIVKRRPGDPAKLVATSKLAFDLLDWDPKYSSLETLLSSMWNIYNNE
ncbi:MAG TPA: UDP-glucose 4-epimerase GalE, partial [Candidatus Marinimicrobia bacterium]|nr:UDP-glucose 4-epimerase GalE [Candidatus Neomarinimicrobiota bacterium]